MWLQVLPITGQNTGGPVEPLLITTDQFDQYCARHAHAVQSQYGVPLVAEPNEAMLGTYAMLDARCRFYSDLGGSATAAAAVGEAELAAEPAGVAAAGGDDDDADGIIRQQRAQGGGHVYGPSLLDLMALQQQRSMGAAMPPVAAVARAEASDAAAGNDGGDGSAAAAWRTAARAAVLGAWAPVGRLFDVGGFGARGGVYEWGQSHSELRKQMEEWGALQDE